MPVWLQCHQCSNMFRVKPSRSDQLCCSHECSQIYRTIPAEVRFWSFVDKRGPDECWLWTGHTTGSDYGNFCIGQYHKRMAHQYSYELHYGPIPTGLCVCHTCDIKLCVNQAHLFLGTLADNNHDTASKHRSPHGENHHNHVLTAAQVAEIRSLLPTKTQYEIADLFDISQSHVSQIHNRRIWKHVI